MFAVVFLASWQTMMAANDHFITDAAYRTKVETSKTYSYHSGRHSFASLITLEAGVPMETICKMLGHKDVKMTQRYARVTQKKLFEDMDKFIAATEKDFVLAL